MGYMYIKALAARQGYKTLTVHYMIDTSVLVIGFSVEGQIKWFIRYSSTDAGLQQYRGNVFTTNSITSSVSWQHNSSDKNN